jgi:hypothetical protein
MYPVVHGPVQALTVFALPAWVVLTFVLMALRWCSSSEESADFAPMPEEFGDFARMREEAKDRSLTLICFESGHHNPVEKRQ